MTVKSGRVSDAVRAADWINIVEIKDIDSKKMRIFVSEGKGKKDRYTVLPQASLEMLRKYYKMYKPKHPGVKIDFGHESVEML